MSSESLAGAAAGRPRSVPPRPSPASPSPSSSSSVGRGSEIGAGEGCGSSTVVLSPPPPRVAPSPILITLHQKQGTVAKRDTSGFCHPAPRSLVASSPLFRAQGQSLARSHVDIVLPKQAGLLESHIAVGPGGCSRLSGAHPGREVSEQGLPHQLHGEGTSPRGHRKEEPSVSVRGIQFSSCSIRLTPT